MVSKQIIQFKCVVNVCDQDFGAFCRERDPEGKKRFGEQPGATKPAPGWALGDLEEVDRGFGLGGPTTLEAEIAEEITARFEGLGVTSFIQKPYREEALLEKIKAERAAAKLRNALNKTRSNLSPESVTKPSLRPLKTISSGRSTASTLLANSTCPTNLPNPCSSKSTR